MEQYLKELLEQKDLDSMENLFAAQTAALDSATYQAKKAVMLALLAKACVDSLDKMDKTGFTDPLAKSIQKVCDDYSARLASFLEQQKENRRLMTLIGRSEAELPEIDRNTAALLERYDTLLKQCIELRDSLAAGNLV